MYLNYRGLTPPYLCEIGTPYLTNMYHIMLKIHYDPRFYFQMSPISLYKIFQYLSHEGLL